jgi:hypothetical protein
MKHFYIRSAFNTFEKSLFMTPFSFLGAKQLWHCINHPPLHSTEVKERVGLSIFPFWVFMACYKVTFTFAFDFMFNICTGNQSCYNTHAWIIRNSEEGKIANIRLVNFRTSNWRAASTLLESCLEISEVGQWITNKQTNNRLIIQQNNSQTNEANN